VNLNLNEAESCGVYKQIAPDEQTVLRPSDAFRIGRLEFVVERFNTGVVSDIGQRQSMEDTFAIHQDLRIHDELVLTYLAVFDGHGGA